MVSRCFLAGPYPPGQAKDSLAARHYLCPGFAHADLERDDDGGGLERGDTAFEHEVAGCVDDAIAIAALFRCLVRALDRDRALNAGFDRVGRAITEENKWHAQRYGIHATFIEPFARSPLGATEWLDQVLDFIAEDIEAFDCGTEIRRLKGILAKGTSADHQVEVFNKAKAAGRQRLTAIKEVVDWAARETQAFGKHSYRPLRPSGFP